MIHTQLSQLDLDSVKFSSEAICMATGGKFLNFTKLLFQTPVLKSPIGVRQFGNTNSLLLTLNENDDFHSLIQHFDIYIQTKVDENYATWFKKKPVYASLVKQNDQYPPCLSFKLKFKQNEPTFSIFNESKEKITIRSYEDLSHVLSRNVNVKLVFSCNTIWYASGRCGICIDVLNIRIMNTPATFSSNDYLFIDSDNDET